MIDDFIPESQTAPGGALVPPPRHPPLALSAGDATPPHRQPVYVSGQAFARELAHTALDALDALGDSIAGAVGLR